MVYIHRVYIIYFSNNKLLNVHLLFSTLLLCFTLDHLFKISYFVVFPLY